MSKAPTSVPGFGPLHDFEPYGYEVDIGASRLLLHLRGDVVRDPSVTKWAHEEVFVDAEFDGMFAYRFEATLFGAQNVLCGLVEESLDKARRDQGFERFKDLLMDPLSAADAEATIDDGMQVYWLDGVLGMSGIVLARRLAYHSRSTRWNSAL